MFGAGCLRARWNSPVRQQARAAQRSHQVAYQPTCAVSVLDGTTRRSFAYDDLDRLTSAYGSGYAYDAAGRLNSVTTPYGESLSYRYNATPAHAVAAVVHASAAYTDSYNFDRNGNMTGRPNLTLGWDFENRLSSAAQPAPPPAPPGGGPRGSRRLYFPILSNARLAEQYAYDADGQRVRKVAAEGATTTIYYIGPHYEVQVTAGQSRVSKYYVFGSGRRIAMRLADGTLNYLQADHLGSTLLATDIYGGVVGANQVRYDAYGNPRTGNLPALPTDNNFTGQKHDSYIKLYQLGSRWYSTHTGFGPVAAAWTPSNNCTMPSKAIRPARGCWMPTSRGASTTLRTNHCWLACRSSGK